MKWQEIVKILQYCRTCYITEWRWRQISRETRKELLKYHSKSFYIKRYVANILNDIHLFDSKEVEDKVKEALAYALYEAYDLSNHIFDDECEYYDTS